MIIKDQLQWTDKPYRFRTVRNQSFTLSLIPHTLSENNIGREKGRRRIVNIECDMLGKYVRTVYTTIYR